jgi:hypothetical protein
MGYLIFILSLIFSISSYGQFKPIENLKFRVGSVQVAGLGCLEDRERPIGSQSWGPRVSSEFKFIFIKKPSYLMPDDVSLEAYGTSTKGGTQNSQVHNSILEMNPSKNLLTLIDKVEPGTWTITLSVAVTISNDSITNVMGVHTDRSKGVEYEILCYYL